MREDFSETVKPLQRQLRDARAAVALRSELYAQMSTMRFRRRGTPRSVQQCIVALLMVGFTGRPFLIDDATCTIKHAELV